MAKNTKVFFFLDKAESRDIMLYIIEEQEIKKAVSELSSFYIDENRQKILWLTESGSKVVREIREFGIDLTPGVQQLCPKGSIMFIDPWPAYLTMLEKKGYE